MHWLSSTDYMYWTAHSGIIQGLNRKENKPCWNKQSKLVSHSILWLALLPAHWSFVMYPEDAAMGNSLLSYVIHQLTCEKNEVASSAKMQNEDCKHDKSKSHSFRLCMGNVLISACQKISDSDKTHFAQKILPPLIQSVEVRLWSNANQVYWLFNWVGIFNCLLIHLGHVGRW